MARAIFTATGVPLATVKVAMRFQREVGLLTYGAHGRNAPDMTSRDLAYTLLTLLADPAPGTRAGEIAAEIGALTFRAPDLNAHEFSLEALRGLKPPFTFADALAALIEVYAFDQDAPPYRTAARKLRDGSTMPPACTIEVTAEDGEPAASIKMGPWQDEYTGLYFFAGEPRTGRAGLTAPPSIASLRRITERNIIPLAEAFAGKGI